MGEGNVIAIAELTLAAAPIADVHDEGFFFCNHIHTYSNAKTVELLSKHVRHQVSEAMTPTGRTAGRTTAKNTLDVIQEHCSDVDDRRAIDEMLNKARQRHKTRSVV
jgi:hypothetical protein